MLSAFLALFFLLSLVVGLKEVTAVFGLIAALLFALDVALTHLARGSRTGRLREPVL
jgi:hypothetical protein